MSTLNYQEDAAFITNNMDPTMDAIYSARTCDNNMISSYIYDLKEYLQSLDQNDADYNYSKMDPDAANPLTLPRPLERVTLARPLLPSAPPKYIPAIPECSLCGSEWAAKQVTCIFCPSSLPDCPHGFCTLCTLEEIAQQTCCPLCKVEIPYYKQKLLRELRNEYASHLALEAFISADNALQLHGPLAEVDVKTDDARKAAQRVVRFLRMEQNPASSCEKALIDTRTLKADLVAFANMLLTFRSACDDPLSDKDRKIWIDVVVAVFVYLDKQQRVGAEVDARAFGPILENNLRKSLKQSLDLLEHPEVELLLQFVVLTCQDLYCEFHKIGQKRTKNVLRRRSRSKFGK